MIVHNKKNNGFTMLEVVVAVFIGMIIVSGIILSMTTSTRVNSFARNLRNATIAGEEKIEELKNDDWYDMSAGSDTYKGFTRTWSVQDDTTSSSLKMVTITVTWPDVWGNTHDVEIATYMYRPYGQ